MPGPAAPVPEHDERRRSQRLLAALLLGTFLFGYPMLAIFNVQASIAGVPLLHAYLFLAWLVLIVLVALIVRSR